MFHFGTNPPRERRDGFVSFRCFLWLGGGGKRTGRRGEDLERKKTGIGEDGSGTRRRMGEDFERMEEDGEDGEWTRRKKKRNFEEEETELWEGETRTLNRTKTGL